MSAIFDTHATVKDLINAGMPEAQAEALTRALQCSAERGDLTTKADIRDMATKGDLKDLEIRLVKWMIGQSIATITILFTLLRFL